MAVSVDQLVAELRAFDQRREIVKALRKGLAKAAVPVRRAIKQKALETMPQRGGLAGWVARISINSRVRVGSRSATIALKGGRNSRHRRSDINAIDRGRVRAPSWGRKTPAAWHTQTVPAGFFTGTAADSPAYFDACDAEVDRALEQIRR